MLLNMSAPHISMVFRRPAGTEVRRWTPHFKLPRTGPLRYLAILGPGLIAANAGNDAGGIATYASAGASYGYSLLWMLLVITVSLTLVQEMAARLGAVTGKGFADLSRERFTIRWTAFVLLSLLVANGVLVVAEFAGIGAAAELFGIPRWPGIAVTALAIWWLVVRGNYKLIERIFIAMAVVFLAYPVAAILAKPDWLLVGRELVLPSFRTDSDYLFMVIATIGTTITPYMQLYIQSAVAEKGIPDDEYQYERFDAIFGAIFADVIAGFIIVATAAALFTRHVDVQSAQDAAEALAPVAGPLAGYLFGIGLFGASALAAAVVPLATTYALTEAFGFERGISRTFSQAPEFLGLFTILIAIGALVAMIPGIPVIQLLLFTQLINGILLPVELFAMLKLVNDRQLMGEYVNGAAANVIAYASAILISLLSVFYVLQQLLGLFDVNLGR